MVKVKKQKIGKLELVRNINETQEIPSTSASDTLYHRETNIDVEASSDKECQQKQIVLTFEKGTDWMESVNLVADKHQISLRAQTELLAEVFKAGGADLNDIVLSKDTVWR